MEKKIINNYKKYFKQVFDYFAEKGYVQKPYPKIILDNSNQGNDILMKTGYFDPETNTIKIYIHDRAYKDCVRSFAHECIHYGQHQHGDIEKSKYSSDKIIEDKNLIHLEAEAYLKGNMGFREWTEIKQKENKDK